MAKQFHMTTGLVLLLSDAVSLSVCALVAKLMTCMLHIMHICVPFWACLAVILSVMELVTLLFFACEIRHAVTIE